MTQTSEILGVLKTVGIPLTSAQISEQLPHIARSNIAAIMCGLKKAGRACSAVEDQVLVWSLPGDVDLANLEPEKLAAVEALLEGVEAKSDALAAAEPIAPRPAAEPVAEVQPDKLASAAPAPAPERGTAGAASNYVKLLHQAYRRGYASHATGEKRVTPYGRANTRDISMTVEWFRGYDSSAAGAPLLRMDGSVATQQPSNRPRILVPGIDKATPLCEAHHVGVDAGRDSGDAFAYLVDRFRAQVAAADAPAYSSASEVLRKMTATVLDEWPGPIPPAMRTLLRASLDFTY